MTSATTLKTVRQAHNFIGIFFAPTILFFAITGGLQMFGLHETSRGSSYVPPALLARLSQLHKKGTIYLPVRKVPQAPQVKADAPKAEVPKESQAASGSSRHNSLAMKIFFAATALALVISTCTGIVMAWKYARRKSSVWLVLAFGIVVPIVLLFL
jgi:hypothetical protein